MRETIEIDEDALAGAAAELGTSTTAETVNAALREIVNRRRRLAFLADAASGAFGDLDRQREEDWR